MWTSNWCPVRERPQTQQRECEDKDKTATSAPRREASGKASLLTLGLAGK